MVPSAQQSSGLERHPLGLAEAGALRAWRPPGGGCERGRKGPLADLWVTDNDGHSRRGRWTTPVGSYE
jgi:hypothetical protein